MAVCATGVLLSTAPAAAYRTATDSPQFAGESGPIAWQNRNIGFYLSRSGLPPGISAAQTQAALSAALNVWAQVGCAELSPYFAGWTEELPLEKDGQNTIAWVSDWADRELDASVPGNTDVQYRRTNDRWQIVEADLYLNATQFSWATSPDGDATDIETVLVHELGHALGLLHPCETNGADNAPTCGSSGDLESGAAMFPLYSAGQASLGSDDIDGICYLYPKETDACGGCARGEACVEDECRAECGSAICQSGEACGYWGCTAQGACLERSCDRAPCTRDAECGPLALCSDGACQSGTAAWGSPCRVSSECKEGACVDGTCQPLCQSDTECGTNGTCQPAVPATVSGCVRSGAYPLESRCREGADCESGLCVFPEYGGFCTLGCVESTTCPVDWTCQPVEGRSVCVPPTYSPSGGCAAVPAERSAGASTLPWTLPILAAWARWRRRRKQSSRRNRTGDIK